MGLFIVGMLQELRGDGTCVDALGHEVMALVAQDTDDFGGERVIEDLDGSDRIAAVTRRHGALFDVLACTFAQGFDVRQKGLLVAHCRFSLVEVEQPVDPNEDTTQLCRTILADEAR